MTRLMCGTERSNNRCPAAADPMDRAVGPQVNLATYPGPLAQAGIATGRWPLHRRFRDLCPPMRAARLLQISAVLTALLVAPHSSAAEKLNAEKLAPTLTLARTNNWLIIRGSHLPGEIRINYLEAYCRTGSTDADWLKHTVISHKNEFISLSPDAKVLRLKDTLADGVTVDHTITARDDEVEFLLAARNPGPTRSEAHWAQPCVRLSAFMGFDEKTAGNATDYLSRCFIFLDGKPARMPTRDWATQARYVPGQTWCPAHVPRADVNPRPLSPLVPDNGLIGAFSADEKMIFATAWEPYQELFQGVARCLHSDFRLGGLAPGERKEIRGKIYLVPADVPALLKRYEKDFPEHRRHSK